MPLTQFRIDLPAIADPHMQGPIVQTLLGSVGAQMDANADQIMWARLQGNPFAGGPTPSREGGARLADGRLIECEPFVLPIHSAQRGIRLYATEPVLSQRIRLSRHLELKRQRGTPWGVIEHVRPYFATAAAYPQITLVFQTNEVTPASLWFRCSPAGVRSIRRVSPSNFNYDDQPAKRTRWWAFFEMAGAGYTPPNTYGDGHTYGDGSVYGAGGASPLTAAMQADIVAMTYDWKAAHSWLAGVVLVWPPATLDITATPTQDPTGWWSLPNGAGTWAKPYNPSTHLGTRPPGYQWIFDNPAP